MNFLLIAIFWARELFFGTPSSVINNASTERESSKNHTSIVPCCELKVEIARCKSFMHLINKVRLIFTHCRLSFDDGLNDFSSPLH